MSEITNPLDDLDLDFDDLGISTYPVPEPKKKTTKPKAAELKELEDPNWPTYQPLDKLSPDDFIDTVISTYYNLKFMQPKIDTIISHNWNIFSTSRVNWQIVLSKPDCIIAPCYHYNGLPMFMCHPFPNCKGMYEVLQINGNGRVTKRLSKTTPLTLKEAVDLCNDILYYDSLTNGMLLNLSGKDIIDDPFCYPHSILDVMVDSLKEYTIKTYGAGDVEAFLEKLQGKGVSQANIVRLRNTSFQHVFYVFDKLEKDVSLTHDELVQVSKLYKKPEILSKRHLYWVRQNRPEVVSMSSANDSNDDLTSVSIQIKNFSKLKQNDKKALKKEVNDVTSEAEKKINERTQEFLQKTKSKGTTRKSAS